MKAIVQDTYGSADVLRLTDIDQPTMGDTDVLVAVHAAGVDPGVWHLMTGRPYLLRLFMGLRGPRARVRGVDVAGVVEKVGAKVTKFKPGDAVYGTCRGSYAEFACVREDHCARMPVNLRWEQAASAPVSGVTALQGIRDSGRVQSGQHVLVIGASGGVGSYAVQIAKAYGAHVTGVCRTSKMALVRSIGADDVLDYTCEDVTDGSRTYDVILDAGGNRRLSHLRRALTPHGTLVLVGGEGGGRLVGGFDRQIRASLISPFVGPTLRPLMARENSADLDVLTALIESGAVTPTVDKTFPLREASLAIRYLEEGRARGKVVLVI